MHTVTMPPSRPLLQRVSEHERQPVPFTLDGQPALALAGDTVLTAILTHCARWRAPGAGRGGRARRRAGVPAPAGPFPAPAPGAVWQPGCARHGPAPHAR